MTLSQTTQWQINTARQLTLQPNTISIWRVYLSEHLSQLKVLSATLAADEQERALRFKFPIHQQNFTVARGVLRLLLARYLNCSAQAIRFQYTEHGKPFLIHPHPVSPLYFNISHSGDIALYAFASYPNLGIDIEHICSSIETQAIAERFFAEEEILALKQAPEQQKIAAFFTIWTRKEAFIKAVGQGLSFPLKDFVVSLADESKSLVSIKGASVQDWSLINLRPGEDYIATLAVKGMVEGIELWDFET